MTSRLKPAVVGQHRFIATVHLCDGMSDQSCAAGVLVCDVMSEQQVLQPACGGGAAGGH